MLDLSQFSQENLKKIQKVLKIVLDTVELQELNRLVGNKVPLRSFEKEDIFYNEIISILNKINDKRENPVLEVLNESLKYEELKDWDDLKPTKELERLENEKMGLEFLGFSKKDLKENIILRIKNLNELREIKQDIDEKIDELQRLRSKPIDITPTSPFHQPTMREIMKDAENGMRELHRQSFEKQLHRESLKQQRILATKENKYSHTVNTITEWAEYYGDGKSFLLDYYYFNFEDRMDDSKMLERFLDKLKDAGCFKSWSRTNYTGGTRFVFIEVSLAKLKSYKENLSKIEIKNTEIDANSSVLIFYNEEAGVGYVGKKSFKFKDHQPEYRVFAKLYDGINKKIARAKVLALLRLKETLNFGSEEDSGDIKKVSRETATYEITELAKKIRERTGLTINTLVLNNGNLTLLGTKLKNPPK